ncbi:MAG: polysaccharide deacetylase family protein [bacterium]
MTRTGTGVLFRVLIPTALLAGLLLPISLRATSATPAPSPGAPPAALPSLALTFDDGTPDAATNGAILAALREAGVHSVLFAAGKRIDSPEGLAQVRAWGEAGHLVGNHTYSHANLGGAGTSLEEFEADALRNEALLKALPGFTRLFRFPYLKEGDTAAKRDGFRAFLRAEKYRIGAVTIDASDWYYDQRFRAWRESHPGADVAPFREAYLAHLWARAQYYDALSRAVLGRSVAHTLLLHTNRINAAFLPDVIRMFRDRGWTLVDASAAFEDPVFAREPDILPAGESLLWALAKEKGVSDLRYPGEDEIYEKPVLDAAGL